MVSVRGGAQSYADELARFVAEQPVQTNEVQRCWGLLPGFLSAADRSRTFSLVELGPSAGLNLFWDHYRYRYPDAVWGPAEAPIELSGRARGGPPAELFERDVEVVRRRGIDRHPVDVTDEAGASSSRRSSGPTSQNASSASAARSKW